MSSAVKILIRVKPALYHRVLALQAFIRMLELEPYRNPAAAKADLASAFALASRPEEKKLVLGLLPRFACPEARALADSAVKDKAALAVARIKERLGAQYLIVAKSNPVPLPTLSPVT